jgi:4-hydroxybenzoate polyprenyltransferase
MNISALVATFMILPIAGLYPLAKRYIKYPQAILASAFNSGIFICALTVNPTLPSWEIIVPLYLSGICWTMIYDTIYGFQDIEDDKKLGLKNTAI